MNSDGVASAEPAAIAFNILHPVWQRWWFLTLVAMATAATVYALYRYRIARLLEMANMRTRIATDLHDDIGANLTRIALLSEVAKQRRRGGRTPGIHNAHRTRVRKLDERHRLGHQPEA